MSALGAAGAGRAADAAELGALDSLGREGVGAEEGERDGVLGTGSRGWGAGRGSLALVGGFFTEGSIGLIGGRLGSSSISRGLGVRVLRCFSCGAWVWGSERGRTGVFGAGLDSGIFSGSVDFTAALVVGGLGSVRGSCGAADGGVGTGAA